MVASGGFGMALQLLKSSLFFIFLILFGLYLSQPRQPRQSLDDTQIPENDMQIPETITKGEVPFKAGQVFEYNVIGYRYGYAEKKMKIFEIIYKLTGQKPYWMAFDGEKISEREEVYNVEGLEEIENKRTYKVRLKTNATVLKPSRERFLSEDLLYYDAATGELLKAELGVHEPSPQILTGKELEEYGIHPSRMFSAWMLEPKKNFKIDNITIELEGMEKLFDRNCFKVKLSGSNYKAINWIDVDRRVLVKGEYTTTDGNLRYEILLKDIREQHIEST